MSTPSDLAALLDRWQSSGLATIVESNDAVTVSGLTAEMVKEVRAHCLALNWICDVQDKAFEPADWNADDSLGPFILTLQKPAGGADKKLLTLEGFRRSLAGDGEGLWQVASATLSFATGTRCICPWGEGQAFATSAISKSPLDLVREGTASRHTPADIRTWLPRADITPNVWADPAFSAFRQQSAPALIRSLASEVIGPDTVVFSGPPRLSVPINEAETHNELGLEGYRHLRAAAAWVYEDIATAEQRHALFAAEFSRSVSRAQTVGMAFFAAGKDILDGARLAFQLAQSDLGREAIKAQSDLRKAIADDMAKAADGTRALATAIAVSIATGVTLIAAKATDVADPLPLSLVAGVVSAYLVVVAWNGWSYLRLQRRLREEWRKRFYRFIPADDYRAMVSLPTQAAERPYHVIGLVALLVAAALAFAAASMWSGTTDVPTREVLHE